ncbi:MAG: RnfABCDGE type electron transport complex subunit G [Eubacteriales bacterium]
MKDENSSARLIITLTLITLAVAGLLGLVNSVTAAPIARKQAETKEAAMHAVLPDADTFTALDAENGVTALYEAKKGDTLVGWVCETAPSGFGGKIGITVGIAVDHTVAGIKVSSHSETAGLGARLVESWFTEQYKGLSAGIHVRKAGQTADNGIDAISGATVTSKAVTQGVEQALAATSALGGK